MTVKSSAPPLTDSDDVLLAEEVDAALSENETDLIDTAGDGMIALDHDYRFSRKLVTLSEPGSARTEAIAAFRTHILSQHRRDGRRALLLCSPRAGAGVTFMASNLAVSTARAGIKTLLIDANLRDPAIDEYIQPLTPRPGLMQFLSQDDVQVGDIVARDVLPHLSVIYAGGTANKSQDLLAGMAFKSLIDRCVRDYDLVIADTPPTAQSADARIISSVLRYALVVVRRGHTYVDDVRTLVGELESDRAKVIGSFLNDY